MIVYHDLFFLRLPAAISLRKSASYTGPLARGVLDFTDQIVLRDTFAFSHRDGNEMREEMG